MLEYTILASILMLVMITFVVFLYYLSKKKIWRKSEELNRLKLQHKDELLDYQFAAIETERERIAFDLHDSINSRLSALKLMLYNSDVDAIVRDRLNVEITSINKVVKSISFDLVPSELKNLGLNPAIESYLEKLNYYSSIRINSRLYAELHSTPEKTKIVFRILEEAISNAMRHSYATEITVQSRRNTECIIYEVLDNGIGLKEDAELGLGLRSMHARASRSGMNFSVAKNQNAQGTNCKLIVPL